MTTAPRIDHVGVIVADLERASAVFRRLLGTGPSLTKEMPEAGIRLARFEAANIAVELIEYVDDGDSFGRKVMGDAIGLNHLSVEVGDVTVAVDAMAAAGLSPQDGFPCAGSTGEIAFFETEPATGVLLEVSRHRKEDDA